MRFCWFSGISLNEECKLKRPRRRELAWSSVLNNIRRHRDERSSLMCSAVASTRGWVDLLPGVGCYIISRFMNKNIREKVRTKPGPILYKWMLSIKQEIERKDIKDRLRLHKHNHQNTFNLWVLDKEYIKWIFF